MEALVVSPDVQIPINEFDFSYARSSGPGGQNVNKVNSKVIMYWSIHESPSIPADVRERFVQKFTHRLSSDGVMLIGSDRFRDQKRNVQDCLEKLHEMLLTVLHPPKPRKKTKPKRSAVERRLSGKRQQADRKKNRQKVDY